MSLTLFIAIWGAVISTFIAWCQFKEEGKIYTRFIIESGDVEVLKITLFTKSNSPLQIYYWKVYKVVNKRIETQFSSVDREESLILSVGKPVTIKFKNLGIINSNFVNVESGYYLKIRVIGEKSSIVRKLRTQFSKSKGGVIHYFQQRRITRKVKMKY